MVTCPAPFAAMAGISVAAVAPEPMTTTFLPGVVQVLRPGQRVDDRPANCSIPGHCGV